MPQAQIQTHSYRPRPGLVARVVNFVVSTATRRRDRARLGKLDPHLLRDIGLDDQAVSEECSKPFWRS